MANETMNLNTPILTLDSDTVLETAQSKADLIWHDIQNAYRTRKILTGILGGIEKTEAGSLIAIIYYKDYRAVIPISEMMINLIQDETHDYGDLSLRQNKVLNNMLGCEIDFVIKGLDTKSRSIVASRKDAMLKKRQIFYFDQDSSGQTKIHEDRIVQARVIAVAEKVVRAEIFGVETSILARDLSFDWLGDARERFQVQLLIKHPKQTFTKESLYQLIWGKDYISDDNTLNVHISKLRKKLEHIGNQAPYIDTIWGIGYKLHR